MEWLATHWAEVLGFVTGAACVALAGLRSVWNFPIGIANNLVFIVLFVSNGLYAAAGLQLVYLAFAVHGWVRWVRGVEHDAGYVARTSARQWAALAAAGGAGAGILWWVLATFTDSQFALADASTTAASLVAQYLLNRKRVENWLVWIAVDIAFAALAFAAGLWITGVLYLLFIVMCVVSLRAWLHVERREASPLLVEAPAIPSPGFGRA